MVTQFFFVRQALEYVYGTGLPLGGYGIFAEEYVIRVLRLVISAVGIYFVTKVQDPES